MKSIKFLILIIVISLCKVEAQVTPTSSHNYVYVIEPKNEVQDVNQITNAKRTIKYVDGLGRPIQTVSVEGASDIGTNKDLIIPYVYDKYGRQVKEFLPIPASNSNGSYREDYEMLANQEYGGEIYYSEKDVENSLLERIKKQGAPGNNWNLNSGHEIKYEYSSNTITDYVRKILFTPSNQSLQNNWNNSVNYYPEKSLYKNTIIDENGNRVIEFKNKYGQIVLKRSFVTNVVLQSERPPAPDPGQNNQVKVDTYYFYDVFGNLVYVLPPLASSKLTLTETDIDELVYQYKYDHKNRLVQKKLPGKDWEDMVYDNQDRLVGVQDGNLREQSLWLFTKYDKFGRVVYTGLVENDQSFKSLQQEINNISNNNEQFNNVGFSQNGINIKYTNTAFPTSGFTEILTVNYYDRYSHNDIVSQIPSHLPVNQQLISTLKFGSELKGMPTNSFIKIIGQDDWEQNIPFYDKLSNPKMNLKFNHLGGYTFKLNEFNFRNLVTTATTYHKRSLESYETEIYSKDFFTYDAQERVDVISSSLTPNQVLQQLISKNTYNKRGNLISKKVGGTQLNGNARWQEINYLYNIRGWLTAINDINAPLLGEGQIPPSVNDDLFAFNIVYNEVNTNDSPHAQILHNGNIAQTFWKTGVDNLLRAYSYSYDEMNRLLIGVHHNPQSNNTYSGAYDEYLSYDLNGNIKQLIRNTGDANGNRISMDDLSYTYHGGDGKSNKLVKVTDGVSSTSVGGFVDGYTGTSNDYTYDLNGNMVRDRNKKISEIQYNHLNLPTYIEIEDKGYISYLYNALGQKVNKFVFDQTISTEGTVKIVDYLDGFQYAGGVLQFFPHAEGYVRATPQNKAAPFTFQFDYVYNYVDHLGNIRLSYTKDPVTNKLKILEENSYYPFGLKHFVYAGSLLKDYKYEEEQEIARPGNVMFTPYQYKFIGQERQDELGLNWDSFRHRNYDYAIGRFFGIDPISEDYYNISTYQFAHNNPVWKIELEGLEGQETSGFDLQKMAGNAWSFTKGFVNTAIDNVTGTTDLRGTFNDGSAAYSAGVDSGHAASFVAGGLLVADGTGNVVAGGTGLVASGAVSTTGVGAVVGVPGAAASGGLILKGTAEVAGGAWLINNAVNNAQEDKKFGGGNDTNSSSSREAYRKAKDQNGVPRSQQPDKVTTTREKGTGKPLKETHYTNSKGEKVTIRKDNPKKYPDGGTQGKHYNAGESGEKLKQHHNYEQ